MDIIPLNLIKEGVASYERRGKEIGLSRLKWSMAITMDNAENQINQQSNLVRMAIVWDKFPNGKEEPKFLDIFSSVDLYGVRSSFTLDDINIFNDHRFDILHDERIELNPTFPIVKSGSNMVMKSLTGSLNLMGLKTIFNGNNEFMTNKDISTGALYMVFRVLNNNINAIARVHGSSRARLYYFD